MATSFPHRQNRLGRQAQHPAIPTGSARVCEALSEAGFRCKGSLTFPDHRLCWSHHEELKSLNTQYKKAEYHYAKSPATNSSTEADRRDKVECGRTAIALRSQVNQRFFSAHRNNQGHVQRILRLQAEVDAIEATLSTASRPVQDETDPSPVASTKEEAGKMKLVYRSLLDPEIPMSKLDHLARDSPAVILKQFIAEMSESLRAKLYGIVPSLDDSSYEISHHDNEAPRRSDTGDAVVRNVLRQYILSRADAETLRRASKAQSVHAYLAQAFPLEIKDYVDFFEKFGRDDTLSFLRDGVCDYLLPPDVSGAHTTKILGGIVALDDQLRGMTIEGWDILYRYFTGVIQWYNPPRFSVRFADLKLVKQLTALGRYGKVDDEVPGWLDLEHDVSQESMLAAVQGLVAGPKGYSDPPIPPIVVEKGRKTEKYSRCYLVARLSKYDPALQDFTRELLRRVSSYLITVFDFDEENDHYWRKQVDKNYDEEDPWIVRSRSGLADQDLSKLEWQVEWSLKKVHRDVEFNADLVPHTMAKDYREFIIIDRAPGREFTISDDIAEILAEVAGYRDMRDALRTAIDKTIPADEQDHYVDVLVPQITSMDELQLPNVLYEGSRVRSWSFADQSPEHMYVGTKTMRSRADVRITRRLVDDMEAKGLITPLSRHQGVHTCPIVHKGRDGMDDIYFPYHQTHMDKATLAEGAPTVLPNIPRAGNLKAFADRYQAAHPGSIATKARVHTNYCSWPLSIENLPRDRIPTFRTVEGLLFRWKVLPFDWPLAHRLWQIQVHMNFNTRLTFAHCVGTTLVVCGEGAEDAEKNLRSLHSLAKKLGWRISVPPVHLWIDCLATLRLDNLWEGVEPDV